MASVNWLRLPRILSKTVDMSQHMSQYLISFAENFTEMAFSDGDRLPVVHEVSPFVTIS